MRGFLIFILLITLTFSGFGLTLDEAVKLARKNNPEIRAARSKSQAAKNKISSISTWPDPELLLTYEQVPQTGSLSQAQMKMYGLAQKIPFPGTMLTRRQQGEALAGVWQEKYRASELAVVAKVKQAYYELFYLEKTIGLTKDNRDLLQGLAKTVETKYSVAKASQRDALLARVEYLTLENNLITLRQQRSVALTNLNFLLSRQPQTEVHLPPELTVFQTEPELAIENSPQLKMAQAKILAQQKVQGLARLEALPDFKVSLMQRELATTGLDGWNVNFAATVPLWFWSKTSKNSEANELLAAAQSNYEEAVNQVRFQAQKSYVELAAAKRSFELLESEIVPQAKQTFKAAQIAYQADQIDFDALIKSQTMYLHSQLSYYKALTDWGKSLAKLEEILGGANYE